MKTIYKGYADAVLTPTEHIKHDIVKLRSETVKHLADSCQSDKEKYAFAVKTKVFAISLEPYTDKDTVKLVMDHYTELETEIKGIDNNDKLNADNKRKTIVQRQFSYALPIFEQSLRILQNSPIVEMEAEGVINLKDEHMKERIRVDPTDYTPVKNIHVDLNEEGDKDER